MIPDYTHVQYHTAPGDPYHPDWDPNYGYGMLITSCGPPIIHGSLGPSDCIWIIPGTKASEQYDD